MIQSSYKSFRMAGAAASCLGALSIAPALAQYSSVGTAYPTTDVTTFNIVAAKSGTTTATAGPATTGTSVPGNSLTLAQFSADVTNAYNANLGGLVGFDEATVAGGTNTISFTAKIGNTANLLTVTSGGAAYSTYSVASYTGGTNGNLAPTSATNGTNGSGYFIGLSGTSGGPAGSKFNGYNSEIYNFSLPLAEFGITAVTRGTAYDASLWVQINGSTTWTLVSAATLPTTASTGGGDTFFEYSAPAGSAITAAAVVNYNPLGTVQSSAFQRLDDFGFVVAPEPSPWVALGLGAIGLSVLTLRARRRTTAHPA